MINLPLITRYGHFYNLKLLFSGYLSQNVFMTQTLSFSYLNKPLK